MIFPPSINRFWARAIPSPVVEPQTLPLLPTQSYRNLVTAINIGIVIMEAYESRLSTGNAECSS